MHGKLIKVMHPNEDYYFQDGQGARVEEYSGGSLAQRKTAQNVGLRQTGNMEKLDNTINGRLD